MPIRSQDFFREAESLDLPLNLRSRFQDLERRLQDFRNRVDEIGLADALCVAMDYLKIGKENPNIDRLRKLAVAFGKNLREFTFHLQQNALITVYDERAESVSLMTLHASKGLEFPVVFITGLENDILPCNLPGLTSDMEEERRLFYVGLTRAQDQLILTSSSTRTIFGKKRNQTPSRFLDEIPAHLITRNSLKLGKKKKPTGQQLSF